jgi:hypothetical protein
MARLATYNKRAKNREWREFMRWARPLVAERGLVFVPYWKYLKLVREADGR